MSLIHNACFYLYESRLMWCTPKPSPYRGFHPTGLKGLICTRVMVWVDLRSARYPSWQLLRGWHVCVWACVILNLSWQCWTRRCKSLLVLWEIRAYPQSPGRSPCDVYACNGFGNAYETDVDGSSPKCYVPLIHTWRDLQSWSSFKVTRIVTEWYRLTVMKDWDRCVMLIKDAPWWKFGHLFFNGRIFFGVWTQLWLPLFFMFLISAALISLLLWCLLNMVRQSYDILWRSESSWWEVDEAHPLP